MYLAAAAAAAAAANSGLSVGNVIAIVAAALVAVGLIGGAIGFTYKALRDQVTDLRGVVTAGQDRIEARLDAVNEVQELTLSEESRELLREVRDGLNSSAIEADARELRALRRELQELRRRNSLLLRKQARRATKIAAQKPKREN